MDHFDEGGVIVIPEGPDAGHITGAHNSFLRYWYAAGLLGAMGFLALFAVPAIRTLRNLKRKMSERTANMIELAVAAYVVPLYRREFGPLHLQSLSLRAYVCLCRICREVRGPVTARKASRQTLGRLPAPNIQATF